MKERTKTFFILVLVIGIVSMTVAYAQLTQRLYITGAGKVIGKSNWNIHFTNPVGPQLEGYALVEEGNELRRVGTTSLENLVATLRAPGDSVSYSFDVKNDGGLNAKISNVFILDIVNANYNGASQVDEELVKQYIYYTIYYTGTTTTPAVGDTLDAGESRNLTLTIGYSEDAPALPDETVLVTGLNAHIDYEMN